MPVIFLAEPIGFLWAGEKCSYCGRKRKPDPADITSDPFLWAPGRRKRPALYFHPDCLEEMHDTLFDDYREFQARNVCGS